MGAAAGPSSAARRRVPIAVVPGAVFVVFTVWVVAGWGGPAVLSALRAAGNDRLRGSVVPLYPPTRQVLDVLRDRNIHVALDDFGSGYSALTYLRKLPIDEVKVDHDLISHVLTDPRAEAIVRAVIDLAHALGVSTVAEGVENADIAQWLRDRGCEIAQGILYSPPITGPAMMELLVSPAPH